MLGIALARRNPFEAAVRSEHQLDESAWIICRCFCFPFSLAGPPENVLKFSQAGTHFGQSGTAEVEKYIGIPTCDLGRPFVPDCHSGRRSLLVWGSARRLLPDETRAFGRKPRPLAGQLSDEAQFRCEKTVSSHIDWRVHTPACMKDRCKAFSRIQVRQAGYPRA